MNNFSPAPTQLLQRNAVVLIAVAVGAFVGFNFGGNIGSSAVGSLISFLLAWRFAQFRYGPSEYAKSYPSARLSVILAAGGWGVELLVFFWFLFPEWIKGDDISRLAFFIMFPLTLFLWFFAGLLAASSARHASKQISEGTRPQTDAAIARAGLKLSKMFTSLTLMYVIWVAAMMAL